MGQHGQSHLQAVARYRAPRSGIATADPDIFIEEQREGYTRYWRTDGKRWEVHGVCDRRGDCLIGAVIEGEQVKSHAHLKRLATKLGRERVDSELDVPWFPAKGTKTETGCCPLRFRMLKFGPYQRSR